jgi:hypothetical protein
MSCDQLMKVISTFAKKALSQAEGHKVLQQSINEMAAPRAEQTNPTVVNPTATTTTGTAATVSSEAVPMAESSVGGGDAKASNSTGGAAVVAPKINTTPLQPNSIKGSKNNDQAVDSSTPITDEETPKTETAPVKSKAKKNRKKNK